MSEYGLVSTSYMLDTAEAIREKLDSKELVAPRDFSKKIREIKSNGGTFINIASHCDGNGEWHRPTEWPNLDHLTYTSDEVYMTIDCTGRINNPTCYIKAVDNMNEPYHVSVGAMVDGIYTEEFSELVPSDTSWDHEFEITGGYQIVKVWSDNDFISWTQSSNNAIIEQVGDIYQIQGDPCFRNPWLERQKLAIHRVVSGVIDYSKSVNLQSLDVSGWGAEVSDIVGKINFSGCYSLPKLDLSCLNTDQELLLLALTPDYLTEIDFSRCYNLKELKLFTLDGTSMLKNIAFTDCYALEELDLSCWDTGLWDITSLQNTWRNCYNLKTLNLDGWEVRNWSVKQMDYTWSNCYRLKELNLKGWDTESWPISNMSYTFQNCFSLKEIPFYAFGLENVPKAGFAMYLTTMAFEMDFSDMDLAKLTALNFMSNPMLVTVKMGDNNIGKLKFNGTNYQLAGSELLSRESVLEIFNALAKVTTTKKILLYSGVYKMLSSEDLKIVTSKGWSVVSSSSI